MTRPARSVRERVLGWATIAAPSLMLVSSLAAAVGGDEHDADRRGGAILVYAVVAFALMIVALALRIGAAHPRAGAALLLIGLAGAVGGAGFGIDTIHTTRHSTRAGSAVLDIAGSGSAPVVMLPLSALLPIAFIGIGLVLFLAEPDLPWRAAVIVLAGALFPVSRVINVGELAVVTDLVFVAALVPLSWSMLRAARDDTTSERSPLGSA